MTSPRFRVGHQPRGPISPHPTYASEMGLDHRDAGKSSTIRFGQLLNAVRLRIDLALLTGKQSWWKIVNVSGKIVNWSYVHSTSHENGEADEISLAGLSGEGADMVAKSLFDANTVLAATTDDTPAALTVAEQRIVGRITGGNIAALTGAEVQSIIAGSIVCFGDAVVCNDNNVVYN